MSRFVDAVWGSGCVLPWIIPCVCLVFTPLHLRKINRFFSYTPRIILTHSHLQDIHTHTHAMIFHPLEGKSRDTQRTEPNRDMLFRRFFG